MLLERDDLEASGAGPEALIEEARRHQRQRMRRRTVVLGVTAALVILGFGVNRLVRGGGGLQAASPSSAALQGGSSGLLAFSRVDRGEAHVMVVEPSGWSRPHDLGPGMGPSWSPDGKQLVFTYEIGHGGRGLGGGLERIFAMNTDGSARHLLPIPSVGSRRFEDWAPAWSPDGSRIAFTRTVWPAGTDHTGTTDLGRSAIYVLDLVHGGLRRVSMPADGGELPAFVAWSPDGQRLAYLGEPGPVGRSYTVGSLGLACTGLHVTNADGTSDHVLAAASRLPDGRDGCVPIWSAAWSPDGHSIAFARSTQPFTGGVDLYLISPNGKHLHRLWHQSNVVSRSPTWSADGKRIAFSFGRRVSPGPGGGEPTQIRTLAVIDRDGSHRHTILRVRGDMYLAGGPAWQPR